MCVAWSTWNPVWRLPSTKAKIFMLWLTWDSFWQSPLTKNMFLLQDDRVWIEDSSSLIFLFLWDLPNVRVHLIFLPFQGQNHDSLLFFKSTFLSLFPILLDYIEDFFLQQIKNTCNASMLDDMHASLPDLKSNSPLFDVPSSQGAFIQSFLYSFHSDVSAVPILGLPQWLLFSLFLKLDHASVCDVAGFH